MYLVRKQYDTDSPSYKKSHKKKKKSPGCYSAEIQLSKTNVAPTPKKLELRYN